VRLGKKSRKGCVLVFRLGSNKYLKKYADNKGTADSPPAQTPRKGSTRVGCVSAIVVNNILYIHNIQLAYC
jgi:hypothetical protein